MDDRRLRLRKETLAELDPGALRAVAAAGAEATLTCALSNRFCEATQHVTSAIAMTCLSTQPSCLTCGC